jgi:hypothetical protein
MKLLVLCSNYPDPNGSTAGMFFHVRNMYYCQKGIEVDVINFGTDKDYIKDKVRVFSIDSYEKILLKNHYDLLVCHAPHISHHYKFLKKYGDIYGNIVFIFHGNEVLKINKILPEEYPFVKKYKFGHNILRNLKDDIKLFLWRKLFTNIVYKSHFIFVSNWLYEQFLRFIKIDRNLLKKNHHIIHNSIGKPFEINHYDISAPKEYDFITIRNNLDSAKYGISIVNELAKNNPKYKFLVIGKGNFFKYNQKADNLKWIDTELRHEDIIKFLNKAYCGLLPTLWDSQGVMTCEFASFGIPTITSDIQICHEILDEFPNVAFIDNNDTKLDLSDIFSNLLKGLPYAKNKKYFAENTTSKEVDLFYRIVKGE